MATRLVRPRFLKSVALKTASRTCEVQQGPWLKQTVFSLHPANHVVCTGKQALLGVEQRLDRVCVVKHMPVAAHTVPKARVLYAAGGGLSALAIMPSELRALLPECLLPGYLAESSMRWVCESFVSLGHFSMGVQGIFTLGIFLNPLFEVIPRLVRERSVGRLPLLPYSAMAGQSLVWMMYGILTQNPALYCPNLIGLVLGLAYWKAYLRYLPPGADWLPYKKEHHFFGMVATTLYSIAVCLLLPSDSAAFALGLLGNLMVIAMFGGPLAAMRTVIKEQSTRCLPFWFTICVNLNCNMWFFYAYFILDDAFICLQDGIGLLCTAIQMALFAKYGIYSLQVKKF